MSHLNSAKMMDTPMGKMDMGSMMRDGMGPMMMGGGMGPMMKNGMGAMMKDGVMPMMMEGSMGSMMKNGMRPMMMEGGMGSMMKTPGIATGVVVYTGSSAGNGVIRKIITHPLVLFGLGVVVGYCVYKCRKSIIQTVAKTSQEE